MADLGWIVPGQSDKDFEAAAFDLSVTWLMDVDGMIGLVGWLVGWLVGVVDGVVHLWVVWLVG